MVCFLIMTTVLLSVYYLFILISFWDGSLYETKEEFLNDLIPFHAIYLQIVKLITYSIKTFKELDDE